MKKILLILAITLCIFQLIVLAVDITIGNPAINGDILTGATGYTQVDKLTPADGTGTITTVEVYMRASATKGIIAIFSADGNTLTAHDFEDVGALVVDYNIVSVNLDVVEGNYIGIYYEGGEVENTPGTSTGIWYKAGNQTQCVDTGFAVYVNAFISLGGSSGVAVEEANAIFFGINF